MDRSKVAYLITEENYQNPDGTWDRELKERKVYVNRSSVTGTEWFEGARTGINPDCRITMFRPDYHGETILELDGRQYSVYRTYETDNDEIELYVEKRQGTS